MAVSTRAVSEKNRDKESGRKSRTKTENEKATTKTAIVKQSSSPSPNLVKQFCNFTNHGAGMEKTLRLAQALAQVGAEILSDTDQVLAKRCALFKGQIALSRRYLRFFKFLECFERTSALFFTTGQQEAGQSDSVRTTLEFGKWSCLGIYYIMEDLTILDAMGVYLTSWSGWVLFEAHKFWFYSLSLSLLGSLWMLIVADKGRGERKVISGTISSPWVKRLVIDGCDLLIPGSMLGWIAVSPMVVGMSMVVSTLLAAQDIWERAQIQARV